MNITDFMSAVLYPLPDTAGIYRITLEASGKTEDELRVTLKSNIAALERLHTRMGGVNKDETARMFYWLWFYELEGRGGGVDKTTVLAGVCCTIHLFLNPGT